jgi:Cu(I)/Ag(I) efflux system membrane fusion protein
VGEKVAVSGAYLIDSESQLRGGGTQDHSQHSGVKPATPAAPTTQQTPAPAKKDSLKMDDMKM